MMEINGIILQFQQNSIKFRIVPMLNLTFTSVNT